MFNCTACKMVVLSLTGDIAMFCFSQVGIEK